MRSSEPHASPPPVDCGSLDPSSIWVLVVVGWLFASFSVSGLRPRARGEAALRPRPAVERSVEASRGESPALLREPGGEQVPAASPSPPIAAGVDLLRSPPRELRRLPSIGPVRAAAIAEWRWQHGGGPFALREVHGIGPRTEERVLRALGAKARPGSGVAAGLARDGLPRDGLSWDGLSSDGLSRAGLPQDGLSRAGLPQDGPR